MRVVKEGNHRLFEEDVETSTYVSGLLLQLRKNGMDAVRDCSRKFDDWAPPDFELSAKQIDEAINKCPDQLVEDTIIARRTFERLRKPSSQR